ncbi:DUF5821 family protein [Halobaculum sp. MBLA0147]|uniref:transcriptional regulator TbsP domain-containing protein n=1 Tax=Halobaculum sp. MBLA0147 TaxID=3079934 RepID=UPI003525CA55
MDSIEGQANKVFAALLDRVSEPVVTLPARDETRAFLAALADREGSRVDLVLAEGVPDRLRWTTRIRAAALVEQGRLSVRVGPAADVVVVDPETVGTFDPSVEPPVGLVGAADVYDRYRERFDRSEPVDLETPGRDTVLARTRETLGASAAETVAVETTRESLGSLDPVSLLVWAGAEGEARVGEVIDTVRDLDVAAPRTVQRRIDSLADEGLITAVPVNDGGLGRPERRLRVAVDFDTDGSLPEPIRAALVR